MGKALAAIPAGSDWHRNQTNKHACPTINISAMYPGRKTPVDPRPGVETGAEVIVVRCPWFVRAGGSQSAFSAQVGGCSAQSAP